MDWNLTLSITLQILAGVSLAACCGLRAFLPPLIVGIAVRFGAADLLFGEPIQLNAAFDWVTSTPALIALGVAVVIEILADKVPWVDHVLDMVETVIRPAAGFFVVAASLEALPPIAAGLVGLVLGGGVAGGVHVAKSKIRVLSTLGTGGLGSPFISVAEDVVAGVGSLLALFLSVFAALAIIVGGFLTFRGVRRYLKRVRSLRGEPA